MLERASLQRVTVLRRISAAGPPVPVHAAARRVLALQRLDPFAAPCTRCGVFAVLVAGCSRVVARAEGLLGGQVPPATQRGRSCVMPLRTRQEHLFGPRRDSSGGSRRA